ncbi:PKD domain-containing protein [Tenacibaculum ovolyticum]|uniref:PKD domain-containing protein n=1 Tax=Tenacibaculum ovolyticum TaxID=104270 RepID=UPI001F3528B7|nr:PKD domain-containing protein [Tenacibaculum ovolyticum]
MKKTIFFIVILFSIYACVNEVALPVIATFSTEIVANDKTVPVKVKIINSTEGADTYSWTFNGASPATSSNRNPGTITYDKEGTYIVKLEASNRDGSIDVKEETIKVNSAINIGFETQVVENNFSPVKIKITNTTVGATTYDWFFEGGVPSTSTKQHPEDIVFTTPGTHNIRLKVSNGDEEYTLEKTIEVAPLLSANFEYTVAFEDDDYQVPVKVTLDNKSISATNYQWTFEGANATASSAENPEIIFNTAGTYTMQLKALNSKNEKTISKTITVYENTNLRTFTNIKLGINTAHKNNHIGAYFSTQTRKVYTQSEVTNTIGSKIDIAFFGLNETFNFNKFISPSKVQELVFSAIPNATITKLINKQESCGCAASASVTNFNAMMNDGLLTSLNVDETAGGLTEFDNVEKPRIVIFETADKRKGVIKINEFVKDGANSYIVIDIKVQKEAN